MAVGIVALALALTLGLRGRSARLRVALSGPSGGKALLAAVLGLLVIAALVALAGLPAGQAVNLRAWFGVALLAAVTITSLPVAGRPWLGPSSRPEAEASFLGTEYGRQVTLRPLVRCREEDR